MTNKEKKLTYLRQMNDPNTSETHRLYLSSNYKKTKRIRFFQILIIVSLIILWEVATYFQVIDSFIFSSPSRMVKTFLDMARDGKIFIILVLL